MSRAPAAVRLSGAAGVVVDALAIVLTIVTRACAVIVFMMLSLAEPFFAAVLGTLAAGCFFVAVLFGFILHAPFAHRWFVLTASVVFLSMYLLYRFVMLGVQRLMH